LNKPFSIIIDYKVNNSITGLTAGFSISQAKESNYLINSNEAEINPDKLKAKLPGLYINKINFPGKLLNVGKYRLKVGLTSKKNIDRKKVYK
jgi:hypothetical protein